MIKYDVSVKTTGNGNVDPIPGIHTIVHGDPLDIIPILDTGWEIDKIIDTPIPTPENPNPTVIIWKPSPGDTEPIYEIPKVKEPHVIEVKFKQKVHTVIVTCSEGGSATHLGENTVNDGEPFVVDITKNTGYKLQSIISNGKSVNLTEHYKISNVYEDTYIIVKFTKVQETTPDRNGGSTPVPQVHTNNEKEEPPNRRKN